MTDTCCGRPLSRYSNSVKGNFLRGFAEHFIDVMNERTDFQGKVVVVPPASAGKTGRINDQEGLYQLCLRGRRNGRRWISAG
ncbi:MAG: hypothetical protein ACLR0P_09190 [Oscillospiraceae bacterium]